MAWGGPVSFFADSEHLIDLPFLAIANVAFPVAGELVAGGSLLLCRVAAYFRLLAARAGTETATLMASGTSSSLRMRGTSWGGGGVALSQTLTRDASFPLSEG